MTLIQDQICSYKQSVAQTFGRSASAYAAQATLQKDCAQTLINLLENLKLPNGKLLEIGCGTGFVTQELIQKFPTRSLVVTDLSEEMLQFCQTNLEISVAQKPLIQFQQQDGETIAAPVNPYALVTSGFVVQWFRDPVKSLLKLVDMLQPGGVLLISFPTIHSFPEWRQICQACNLPFTANPLPDPQPIAAALSQATQCHQILTQDLPLYFTNTAEFLRSFKAIGANLSQTGKQLSVQQMRQLIRAWDARSPNGITVHFQVCFGVFQR
jgi:malonyl-CoA O-methyltransferase